jgi:putative heme-binding domain-containing protein
MLSGKGISIGPDLTLIGFKRGQAYLEEAVRNPGKQKIRDENGFTLYLVVEVTLSGGRTLRGIRLNEDTFTLQVKDAQNQLYSFRKSELKAVLRPKEASLMPSFASTLSKKEIDDLVGYLMSQK